MNTESLLSDRWQSEALLDGPLQKDAALFLRLRKLTNEAIIACQAGRDFLECRITGLTLLKSRRLSDAIIVLVLEGLGQEAGALFRVLQEIWELLIYLEQDDARFEELSKGNKPTAGKIAKMIGAEFKGLRDHLNRHASHFALTADAMGHLVDMSIGAFQLENQVAEEVVRRNMAVVFAVQFMATGAAVVVLSRRDPGSASTVAEALDELRDDAQVHLSAYGLGPLEGA